MAPGSHRGHAEGAVQPPEHDEGPGDEPELAPVSASVKCSRIRCMKTSSISVWLVASRPAKSSAASSRALGGEVPASLGSRSAHSPGALSEGSRAVAHRAHSLRAAILSRTSSLRAKGRWPPYFAGR